MHNAVILLGTNKGKLLSNLEQAIELIEKRCGYVVKRSLVYETEPWGLTDQPFFLNQVIEISTGLTPRNLLNQLLDIEAGMGRKRSVKWEPRLIDLDILFYEDGIVKESGLTIPHQHLHERRFTLVPLAEILPDFVHPILGKTTTELLNGLADQSRVALTGKSGQPVKKF